MDEHVFYSLGHTKKVRNFCRAVEPSKAKEQIEGRLSLKELTFHSSLGNPSCLVKFSVQPRGLEVAGLAPPLAAPQTDLPTHLFPSSLSVSCHPFSSAA